MRITLSIKLGPAQAQRLQNLAEQCCVTAEQMASTVAVLALNRHLDETPILAAPMSQRFEQATDNPATSGPNPARPASHALVDTGFLRLTEIVGVPAKPGQPASPRLVPVSRSTWLAGVKCGLYPKPVKLRAGVTAWRVEDIRALIQNLGAEIKR